MGLSVDIIKSNNRSFEKFDRSKLHKSIVAVCVSVRTPHGQAEATAHSVCDTVIDWLKDKNEVTSQDIRNITVKHLKRIQPEAAYLYEQHHIII